MSGFRECALVVFENLGMRPLPSDRYLDDLERLNEAAGEWHMLPEAQRLGFLHFDLPDLREGVMVAGNLASAVTAGWACNDAAKAFVHYIDERTGKRGTLLMLQVILLIQMAVQENKVNAAGGEA